MKTLKFTSFFNASCLCRKSLRPTLQIFAYSALVGIVAGLGAVLFHSLLELTKHYILDGFAGFHPTNAAGEIELFQPFGRPPILWILTILPAIGGLLSGILVFATAPEAEGHGTDAAIDAYHQKDGLIRARVPFIKTIASALTIGTGGSAGTEGPISQIGAGFGSLLARAFNLSLKERRILLAAGMGAGIGAIFRTPLAGALFAAEVLYREMDFEYEVLTPAILSSVTGYSVFALFFGFQPLFATPDFAFRNPLELVPYTALALAVALGAKWFTRFFYTVRDLFRILPIPNYTKPMLGGLITGIIGLALPEALSTGYGVIQGAFTGGSGIYSHPFGGSIALALFIFALAKMCTTTATVASGGSGGVFGPAIVIGGALGGATGTFIDSLFPGVISAPGAFAIVGMAGFFAAAARTPISTVIMVSEMTGNYELLVPSMWVAMLAFLATSGAGSLYEKQAIRRSDSILHQGDMIRSALERLFVKDADKLEPKSPPVVMSENVPLKLVLERFDETGVPSIALSNDAGRFSGQLVLEAVRQTIAATEMDENSVTAKDVALSPLFLHPDHTLAYAIQTMGDANRSHLFVLDESGKILSLFGEEDVGALCRRQMEISFHEDERPQCSLHLTSLFSAKPSPAISATKRTQTSPDDPGHFK